VLAGAAAADAGPCTQDIAVVQGDFDARLNAAAASGQEATESTYATMHRQPTLNSVAGAEERLGELPPAQVEAFTAAMKRALDADAAGDGGACQLALNEAKHTLGE
jgi:hypothetical protein